MSTAQLLDCTLRDGAYLVDKTFGDDVITGIISGLVHTGVDIVEIGFLQNEGFGAGKTVFHNSKDAARFIPEDKGRSIFTAFADYSRYSADNLDDYDGKSFDAVRACFFKAERFDAMDFCRKIKEKGYKLFVQPVDVMGYSDQEMLDLIGRVNEIKPYCFSIVDTFGSMYQDDLTRIFSLIHHNLDRDIRIGFHSHNNLQMSSALSQAFLHMAYGLRDVIVDSTVSGMGRGAGNTPTELIAQYMVSKLGYHYDMDELMDLIDTYIQPIRSHTEWGYSTPLFLAGTFGAHVNNIHYLSEKTSIRSKGIRYILDKIGAEKRKRYDYSLLENTYLEYIARDIDDSVYFSELSSIIGGRSVVLLAPGASVKTEAEKIRRYIADNNSIVISTNFVCREIDVDFIFVNNIKRYTANRAEITNSIARKIFGSNIPHEHRDFDYEISFNRVVRSGWKFVDNSSILLLRLLEQLGAASVGIAGMDGYSSAGNYVSGGMERMISVEEADKLNQEISDMLNEFISSKKPEMKIEFITATKYLQEK